MFGLSFLVKPRLCRGCFFSFDISGTRSLVWGGQLGSHSLHRANGALPSGVDDVSVGLNPRTFGKPETYVFSKFDKCGGTYVYKCSYSFMYDCIILYIHMCFLHKSLNVPAYFFSYVYEYKCKMDDLERHPELQSSPVCELNFK